MDANKNANLAATTLAALLGTLHRLVLQHFPLQDIRFNAFLTSWHVCAASGQYFVALLSHPL